MLKIIFDLKKEEPKDFEPSYSRFETRGLRHFKVSSNPENKNFPFNADTSAWEIKIIFFDFKCIMGILTIPTIDNAEIYTETRGRLNYIPVNFIISKIPIEDKSIKIRQLNNTPFFDKMLQEHVDAINKFINKTYAVLIEEVRKYSAEQEFKLKNKIK